MIRFFLAKIYRLFQKSYENEILNNYRKKFGLHPSIILGPGVVLDGNIFIGANTYINSGIIQSGKDSKIIIGEWCAIGNNVNILAVTHDTEISTGKDRPVIEKDINIGNHVWIGSNVYIREGINIGDNTIIGANSVVIKDVPENAIVGGIPAKILKFKERKNK